MMRLRTLVVAAACFAFSLQCGSGQQPPTTEQFLSQHKVGSSLSSLREALHNPDPDVRGVAAGVLAERRDVASIPLLRAALSAESAPKAKIAISNALAELDRQRGGLALIALCNNPNAPATNRLSAALSVLDLGRNDCLTSVVNLLSSSPDAASRGMGLSYLSRITSSPDDLQPRVQLILVKGLADPTAANREHASEALSVLGDGSAAKALELAIRNEKDLPVRSQMEHDLSRLRARIAAKPKSN
jgi:HEAT repeat protein